MCDVNSQFVHAEEVNFVHWKVFGRVWEITEHAKQVILHHSRATDYTCGCVKRCEMKIFALEANSNVDKSGFWKVWGSSRLCEVQSGSITCMTNKNGKVYISRPTINDNKKSATGLEPQNKITKKEDTWLPRLKKIKNLSTECESQIEPLKKTGQISPSKK